MVEHENHLPARPVRPAARGQVPQLYKPFGKGRLPELYLRDAKARRLISRLKWFISTCIVGTSGVAIIGIAIYASTGIEDGSGVVGSLRSATLATLKPREAGNLIEDSVAALGQKTDRIKTTSKGLTTRYVIQDSIVERRNNREFIKVKPYIRIFATLSTEEPQNRDEIPPFNPFDLYAEQKSDSDSSETVEPREKARHNAFMKMQIVELAGGFLPEEDSQQLTEEQAERIVAEADVVLAEASALPRIASADPEQFAEGNTSADTTEQTDPAQQTLLRTTTLVKTSGVDDADDNTELTSFIVERGDTLIGILKNAGAKASQANAISEVLMSREGGLNLRAGQEVRLKLAAAIDREDGKDPIRMSLFSGVKSEGTVELIGGEYRLSDNHVRVTKTATQVKTVSRATLYDSIYGAALKEELVSQLMKDFLRVFSYDVDYKQKVRPGDGFELFFDVEQMDDGTEKPGELLYVGMTIADETYKYYRFRTPDGEVDFYNTEGSNSRKFLMRKPIKSGRFTSGFGYRRHPLLGVKKMHNGVDWAAPTGTPIMAAGNGTIVMAGRHGGNGNFIRIRHGNGYRTSYSHLSKIEKGIKKGAKVRQGQLIGYVGTTGLSTGPHLHYQVEVNERPTNPLKIHVPRSRQLNSRMLAEFRKEAERIDELMRRTPVKTRVASADE
ncbi:MAG: peptidoglycan DD-metalloendopeptidase family protein [Hyphomicrobiales bacterium]|nr:peptidoglycan DD-metalloendopeptidase family protein [Hyphomicrobiales bacterium]